MCEMLVDEDAAVDAVDRYGWTPLMLAAWRGHGRAARLLVMRGANVIFPHKTMDNETPITMALRADARALIEMLVYTGRLDPNDRLPPHGRRPLEIAAEHGRAALCVFLIAAGARPSMCTEDVIRTAVVSGHVDVCKVLVASTPQPLRIHEFSAVTVAATCGTVPMLQVLLGEGRIPKDRELLLLAQASCRGDRVGSAESKRRREVVRFLMELGPHLAERIMEHALETLRGAALPSRELEDHLRTLRPSSSTHVHWLVSHGHAPLAEQTIRTDPSVAERWGATPSLLSDDLPCTRVLCVTAVRALVASGEALSPSEGAWRALWRLWTFHRREQGLLDMDAIRTMALLLCMHPEGMWIQAMARVRALPMVNMTLPGCAEAREQIRRGIEDFRRALADVAMQVDLEQTQMVPRAWWTAYTAR